jgi:hypothetical protein
MRLALAVLMCMPLWAQVEARFYPQPLKVGTLTVYGVDVCNGSDQMMTVQGATIWQQSSAAGVNLALPTTILQEQQNAQGPRTKRLALYILSGISAGAVALAGGGIISVSADTPGGKVYYATLSAIAVAAPLIASQVEKTPSDEITADMSKLVPGLIQLGPHACQSFVHPGVPR